jgi:hypothetical protein
MESAVFSHWTVSSSPLNILARDGRILLSASAEDEAAYEDPASRHGLLTRALLAILVAADGALSSSDKVFATIWKER